MGSRRFEESVTERKRASVWRKDQRQWESDTIEGESI